MTRVSTRERILAAAEKLFAQQGVAATSLREIIREAGVNTAAIHYHFGSKSSLLEAVLRRRAAPINERRLRMLSELESLTPRGEPLPVEGVVAAFITPVLEARLGRRAKSDALAKLMARVIAEADESTFKIMHGVFADVVERFRTALARALPGLPPEDIIWRMHFMIGALSLVLVVPLLHAQSRQGPLRRTDPTLVARRLVAFVTAGMKAEVENET